MRKLVLAVMLLALLAAFSGCAPQMNDPLLKNEATDVPGLAMNVNEASTLDASETTAQVTLYFRYMDEPALAAETRTISVPRDESLEYAIVEALVNGPSAGHSDLKRLLPAATKVESVVSRDELLFVTFDDGFLEDGVPDNWAADEAWQTEAPLMRRLITQSIAASLTESTAYTGVQILVHKEGEVQASLRLDNSYFLQGATGLSDPVVRDETLLLTPQNTADTLLTAWQQHDATRLYRYMAEDGKPVQDSFEAMLSVLPSLAEYTVSGGSVAQDGQTAVITCGLRVNGTNGETEVKAYPLLLTRENGIWKMTWAQFETMANR